MANTLNALLNTSKSTRKDETLYKDPRANIIYGGGNSAITNKEIHDYVSAPGRTEQEIEGAMYKYGVSRNQLLNAGTQLKPENVDKYITAQGITKEFAKPDVPLAANPSNVTAGRINVGSNDTVQGQLAGILKDPNSPLNIQSQTYGLQSANKRGLLNSSIAVSAAQDAMYKNSLPIASQDASTYYDANKSNVQNKLTADMFNSDLDARVNMFNTGVNKDLAINTQNTDLNRYVADLDAGNKLAIANIQAMSTDSGIMGDLGKTMMDAYYKTASDPNISPEVKKEMIANITGQFQNLTSLLPSFKKIAPMLNFGAASNADGASGSSGSSVNGGSSPVTGSTGGAVATPGMDGKVGSFGSVVPEPTGGYKLFARSGLKPVTLNSSDYKLTAPEITQAKASMQSLGINIDLNDIAPQSLIEEINRMQGNQVGMPDPRFFVNVPVPGSLRGDNLAFSIYRAALPKYQK